VTPRERGDGGDVVAFLIPFDDDVKMLLQLKSPSLILNRWPFPREPNFIPSRPKGLLYKARKSSDFKCFTSQPSESDVRRFREEILQQTHDSVREIGVEEQLH
jgi:hypothetical protein